MEMTITIKVTDKTKQEMIDFYNDLKRDKTPDYSLFQAVDGDTVVTLYTSGKAVFQGNDADLASLYWIETEKINAGTVEYTNSDNKKKEKKVETKKTYEKDYIHCTSVGSDEVGTGDYFGPIVVTASLVKLEDVEYLQSLGVCDSKKLTDEKILEIAPLIAKRIKYTSLVLSNSDYNKYHKDYNMNKVKAIMHNKVLYQLMQDKPKVDYIIVDEFAKPFTYYKYLEDSKFIQRGITFMTKAEDKNLAVAASSIISRYLFLKEYKKLESELGLSIPKGAGFEVDKVGREIVNKFGKDKLKEIAKLSFKNTERNINE